MAVNAEAFLAELVARSESVTLHVPMGTVFALSKSFVDIPPIEIERLLDSPWREARAGALSIMDKQAAKKTTAPPRREELYDLYMRHLDLVDDWRLVDVSCRYTVGAYLFDKPRDPLYRLARSTNEWHRRIAMVSTWYFISQHDTADAFAVAAMLLQDDRPFVLSAVGWMLREAGRKDQERLEFFLGQHASTMPRVVLRSATARMDPARRRMHLDDGRAR